MNIHITDQDFYKALQAATLIQIRVGSHLYGLNDEYSDTDILCIYAPAANEQVSFSFSHHQFQYKDKVQQIDYVFVSIFNFIRNAINGDSTLNFEAIYSEAMRDSPLGFLYDLRVGFRNYMVLRSYLGLARRDIKNIFKQATNRDKNKAVIHAYRGYYFAKSIYEDNFRLQLPSPILEELRNLKKVEDYKIRRQYSDNISERINQYRAFINKELDKAKITKFMKVEYQKQLDQKLLALLSSKFYQDKIQNFRDLSLIYEANEYGVKY